MRKPHVSLSECVHEIRRPILLWLVCAAAIAQNLPPQAMQQIQALMDEKEARTPAQKKLDSQLHYAHKMGLGQTIAPGIASLSLPDNVQPDAQGLYVVDIVAKGNPGLLAEIRAQDGQVINSFPQYNSVRARLPLLSLEVIANRADVSFIRPADEAHVNRAAPPTRPTFTERAGNVRAQLLNALPVVAANRRLLNRFGLAFTRPIDVSGDIAHQANLVRSTFGFDGTGVKVGVLSNGVDPLATMIAAGNLPNTVTVLPGQAGGGAEGTAMLEIVYDLAPGAQLYFATANGGQANFANNILALRAAGCDIIVDDVTYFAEGLFQDGVISNAVNTVTASGALYFSSAQNSGNLTTGNSGTWEGDFSPSGFTINNPKGSLNGHNFSGTNGAALITATTGPISIKWSDPLGASCNDYDLFVFSNNFSIVVAASTTVQSCASDPFEIVGAQPAGAQIIVANTAAAAVRALHLDTERGRIQGGTAGATFGHNAAGSAITVAAVNVATAGGGAFTGGAANPVEPYSSDGPRRIFYDPSGNPLTPGNFLFSTNSGTLLQKDDMAAADCAPSATPGFPNPFCGTSAAAPHAAAIAALVKSARPSLSAAQIHNALNASALDIMAPGIDRDSGVGIVMALGAVQSLTTNVTIQSSPSGLSFTVSGTGCAAGSYVTPSLLPWHLGSSCTVSFASPQSGPPGTRYVFAGYSDLVNSNPRTFTTPLSPTAYTANFTPQYFLTTAANPPTGGTVSGSAWYNAGSNASVLATPAAFFTFIGFTGDITTTINPATVAMNAPKTIIGNFAIPTATVVNPAAGQYSDPVTLLATVSPVSAGGFVISGTVQFAVNGVNTGLPAAVDPGTGVATLVYTIPLGQGPYPIKGIFIPSAGSYFGGSSGTNTLTVSRENASVTPSSTNPLAVKVNAPGGTAGPITVSASIAEVPDGSPGDISKAVPVTCELDPIVPGTTYTVTAVTSGGGIGGTLTATCTFPSVQVNAYSLTISIGGNYYTGSSESVLAVYDPSLGFVTGGGTVPHNANVGEFGFNAKYLKNGKPQGNVLYIEHQPTGDVVIQGVAAQSLSIVGSTAVIINKAVVNGTGNYLLIATVTDNGEPGINVDMFGLEVRDSNGIVVPGLTFPQVAITGGNIQVPHQ